MTLKSTSINNGDSNLWSSLQHNVSNPSLQKPPLWSNDAFMIQAILFSTVLAISKTIDSWFTSDLGRLESTQEGRVALSLASPQVTLAPLLCFANLLCKSINCVMFITKKVRLFCILFTCICRASMLPSTSCVRGLRTIEILKYWNPHCNPFAMMC